MRGPITVEEFSRVTRVDIEDLQRYKNAQLLDPAEDGLFDEFDLLRLRFLQPVAPGRSPEELAAHLEDLGKANPWADVLYGANVPKESAEAIGDSSISYKFRVLFIPTTFVLDRRGRIAARITGATVERDLTGVLDAELAR